MEERKESLSKKRYKDSPKMERKEGGKMGVSKKPEHKKEEKHEGHAMSLTHKQEKERLSLHQKHEMEHHDLAAKHLKETAKPNMVGADKDQGPALVAEQAAEGGQGEA